MKKEKIVDNRNTEENQAPEEDVDTLENEEDTIEESTEEAVDFSQEIEKLKAENLALKNEFLRAYADAENTKKRCTQEIEKNTKYAISSFAKDLLSVADNLHRAIEALPEAEKAK